MQLSPENALSTLYISEFDNAAAVSSANNAASGTAVLTGSDDFANCNSEGGAWQCASCREKDGSGGALPCDAYSIYRKCPDSLVKGKAFFVNGHNRSNGVGACKPLYSAHRAQLSVAIGFQYGSMEWGKAGTGSIDKVLSKLQVGHPRGASPHEGYVIFKRVVMHKTKTNDIKADVMKVGYCVRCPLIPVDKFRDCRPKEGTMATSAACTNDTSAIFFSDAGYIHTYSKRNQVYNKELAIAAGLLSSDGKFRSVFHSNQQKDATDIEKRVFTEECFVNAFNATGDQKEAYACSTSKPDKDSNHANRPWKFRTTEAGNKAFSNVLLAF